MNPTAALIHVLTVTGHAQQKPTRLQTQLAHLGLHVSAAAAGDLVIVLGAFCLLMALLGFARNRRQSAG